MAETHVTLTNATNSTITHGVTIVFHSPGVSAVSNGAANTISKVSAGRTGSGTSGQVSGTNVIINNPA